MRKHIEKYALIMPTASAKHALEWLNKEIEDLQSFVLRFPEFRADDAYKEEINELFQLKEQLISRPDISND